MTTHAQPTSSSAAASTHGAATPSLALLEARQLRDSLKLLLRAEQSAMAEFLVALADFDRRRGWEALGYASLFAFLVADLGLSTSSTYWRQSAARLLRTFPELERELRQGRLCLTTTAELARVLTEENKAAVLPRFLGISSREAKEIVAELQPREAPPLRSVVTLAAPAAALRFEPVLVASPPTLDLPVAPAAMPSALAAGGAPSAAPVSTDPESFRAPEMKMTHPARDVTSRDDVEPLTGELRRLHVTVSRKFLEELESARGGLSHAIPNATTEQVLQTALRLLLERQARARGQLKRPRKTVAATATEALATLPTPTTQPTPTQDTTPVTTAIPIPTEPPPHRRDGHREAIPAPVRRAVWARDRGRCSWPIDRGGVCGSTHRLELDHVVPWARGGETTVENLRLTCSRHNLQAARQAFGERTIGRYRGVREPVATYGIVERLRSAVTWPLEAAG